MQNFDEDSPNNLTPTKKRSNHKLPQIRESNGRYQITGVWQGKRYYVSTGLAATPTALNRVNKLKASIEADIMSGLFDDTLERYYKATGVKRKTRKAEIQETRILALSEAWDFYLQQKSVVAAESTVGIWYRTLGSWVKQITDNNVKEPNSIREFIANRTSEKQAKRVLAGLQTAIRFCTARGLKVGVDLAGQSALVLVPKGSKRQPTPLSASEVEFVLKFIKENYGDDAERFTRFCFLTGCRTSEAVALPWSKVRWGSEMILFELADIELSKGKVVSKGIKTGVNRAFPITPKLEELLKSVPPCSLWPNVFTFDCAPISLNTYSQVWFKSAINALNQSIDSEIKATGYSTRSTFITAQLRKGMPVADVAALVGNSPQTIYKHYAGVASRVDLALLE